MRVWMYECFKEIEGGFIVFTLATGVTELGELQSETSDRDPCSSLGTELAWPNGVSLRFLPVPWRFPERFDRLGGSDGLVAEISFLVSPGLA